jgi:hypothetical protein
VKEVTFGDGWSEKLMVIGQWKISPPLMTTSEPPPECWGQEEHKFEGFVVPELMVGWENGWVVLGTQQLHCMFPHLDEKDDEVGPEVGVHR